MAQVDQGHSETFFVHQDEVFAKVVVVSSGKGWTINVPEVRRPNGGITHPGHLRGVTGTIGEARATGVLHAQSMIASALGRAAHDGGHVLRAASKERSDGTGWFDPHIEVSEGDHVVERHLLRPMPPRDMAESEAMDFAAQSLRRVSGVRRDGTLVI